MMAEDLHKAWRLLPFGSLADVTGTGRTLVLAPHPDDESLGCGGLIAACCASGRAPIVAVLTDGSRSHPNSKRYPPEKLAALREVEVARATAILGLPVANLVFLRQPDSGAPVSGPAFARLAERLSTLVHQAGCTSILAPWRHDPHGDHEAAACLATVAANACGIVLMSYPVWGWTLRGEVPISESMPRGWRVDISAHVEAKQRAIAAHQSQYGTLIDDDPAGFRLPNELLRAVAAPWETFLLP